MGLYVNLGADDVLFAAGTYRLESRPLWWQLRGLSQTASGYGRKLATSQVLIGPDNRARRVYASVFSNSGTTYVIARGRKWLVDDTNAVDIVGWGPYGIRPTV